MKFYVNWHQDYDDAEQDVFDTVGELQEWIVHNPHCKIDSIVFGKSYAVAEVMSLRLRDIGHHGYAG